MTDLFKQHIEKKPYQTINDIKFHGFPQIVHLAKTVDGASEKLLTSTLLPLLKPFKHTVNKSATPSNTTSSVYTLLEQQTLLCLPFTSF